MKSASILFLVVLFALAGAASALAASEAKIAASDAQASDYFGRAAGISGDYAIVGADGEDGSSSDAGAGYIYHRTDANTWDAGVKIVAFDPQASDYFGKSVAISGDFAIVGAFGEDAGGSSAGAAYTYHRTDTNVWDTTCFKLAATDPGAGIYFGYSVGISGLYAIVGAPRQDTGGSDAGAAYIYTGNSSNVWGGGKKIVASDPEASDQFGYSVAISGDYAIVGAPNEDAGGSNAGAAYIYYYNTGYWNSVKKIVASDAQAGDLFGYFVAISGDYAIVGAPNEDAGGSDAGAAYIFHRTGGNVWNTGTKIVASDPGGGDLFGNSVAISGVYAIVGARQESAGGSNAGAAYLFNRTDTTTWSAATKIVASDPEANDYFGYSVGIYGDYALVGAYYEDPGSVSDAGSAYIIKHDLPTAIDLVSFEAEWADAGAALHWMTGSETECGAFTLLRCELDDLRNSTEPYCPPDEYQELDIVIPCEDSMYGAEYEAFDATADPGANYSYILREYETTGGVNEYGPVTLYAVKDGAPSAGAEQPSDDDDNDLAPPDDPDSGQASDDDDAGESDEGDEESSEEESTGCGW